ncbi:hypothetical protein GWC77_16720 [Paraburkholderia sp. NMBU_R16]|uniref:hypothetical protein n=1 Tax=Paraburkholderia sp. NMBU_R16 TaxID=2698676 RepID=UPI001567855C|nr:hypothetical protein [Paraburkholderia sp. NMBU_R16]NRO97567.1 hypothetical protein [Paraburkholderia sp. NMBU_R16]
MTKVFAIVAAVQLLGLAACGSSPTASNDAAVSPGVAARTSDSAMAFTSHRTPSSITSCLSSRMHGVHRASSGTATELVIGNGARTNTWRITLAPAGAGSAVNVHKPSSDDGSVSEPELRYHIARCVV